jgi:hypothetical protein
MMIQQQQQQPPAALHLPYRQHPLIYNHRCSSGIEKKPLGYHQQQKQQQQKSFSFVKTKSVKK